MGRDHSGEAKPKRSYGNKEEGVFRGLNRLYLETNWMWDDQLLAWVKMEDGEDMRSVSVTLCFRQQ